MNKPHYNWKDIFMSTEMTKADEAGVPDWARRASTGASFGNIDASDLKPPRLKVLAGQSPEVTDGTPNATPGNFWLTVLNQNLGKEVIVTPILLRKTYQAWAPKGAGTEQKGPLATASDGIHWDVPNQVFEIKFPGNPKVYKWHIKKTVFENGLHKFGSSQDDNPSSKPAATLTYDILFVVELPNGAKQLCVFTSARTGVGPTQNFISTTKAMGIDQFYQRYRIIIKRKTGPTGDPYFTYEFQYAGPVTEKDGEAFRSLYDQYRSTGFVVDMAEEAADIHTEQRTEGTRRDYEPPPSDVDDSIPF